MFKFFKLLTAAAFLMTASAYANAAPMPAVGANADISAKSAGNLIEVHGRHSACRVGARGWHRHVWRRGERVRIPCHSYRRDRRHRFERDCVTIGDFLKFCPN
jgi:hypothetical protein